MTTSRIQHDYYTPDEFTYKNNKTRIIPRQNYNSHAVSNNKGVITSRTKKGSYNVIEKDFGDHRIIYHVPFEYGEDYDVSQLEDIPIVEEQQISNSPRIVRHRIYQQYNDDDDYDDDDYEYADEIPVVTPRRRVYVSPRRQRDTQVVRRINQSPAHIVEYIYEDDYPDVQDYRPENEEEVEYIVQERAPKPIYMEESRPARRTIYVQDPAVPPLSPQPPASYSPRRSPYQAPPRAMVNQRSPSLTSTKPNHRNNISPPLSTRKQQPARSPPLYEPPVKPNIPKTNEPPLRLMDVIAQNRAKRGPNIPKPRREVHEESVYDPPTYKRNIIKNGFIVHK